MNSDSPLALWRRVKQSTLDVDVGLVSSGCASAVLKDCVILLQFVRYHLVHINGGADYEVIGLGFYLNISIRSDLGETKGYSYTEDSFPSYFSGKTVVKLISKLHSVRPCIELRIVVEVARWFARDVSKSNEIFILIFAMRKDEEVNWDVLMS